MSESTAKLPLAWITGGASGIGFSSAQELAKQGYRVAISGRDEAKVASAVEKLEAAGHQAVAAPLDVTDIAAVKALAATLQRDHGAISVLVACAGSNVSKRYWRDLTGEDFAQVTNVNLNGVANVIVTVLPGMREAAFGSIVVISSWGGWRYLPVTSAAYGASKFGLAPLVESINDQEGLHGIRATLVCPAEVATPILRSRPVPPPQDEIDRMLQPEDVGKAVAYAVSVPAHVCINELVISPSWNRFYLGGDDLLPKR